MHNAIHAPWTRNLAAMVICLLSLWGAAHAHDSSGTKTDHRVIGRWKIVSVLDYAHISIGEEAGKRLLGTELFVTMDNVRFGDRDCDAPEFSAESVETNHELNHNARVGNDRLRLPNPVTVVELSCAYVYVRNDDRMVLAWNGIFFDIARLDKKRQ